MFSKVLTLDGAWVKTDFNTTWLNHLKTGPVRYSDIHCKASQVHIHQVMSSMILSFRDLQVGQDPTVVTSFCVQLAARRARGLWADAFLPFFLHPSLRCCIVPLSLSSPSVHSPLARCAANCTQNDVTTVRSCPTCKSQKPRLILLQGCSVMIEQLGIEEKNYSEHTPLDILEHKREQKVQWRLLVE